MRLKVILLRLIFIIISCYWLYWLDNQNFSKGLLPEKIEVSSFVLSKEYFDLREGCGIRVFKLSKNTLDKINQQKLNFFKNATKARGYDADKHRYNKYYSYAQWQETPVQESKENKKFWSGLGCAKQLEMDESLSKKITLAASTKGSYYTGHYEGQLVVIPSLGIVVFSYNG